MAVVAVILTGLAVPAGGGCGSKMIEPSGVRPAVEPSAVMIYEKAPEKYEDLGVVNAAGHTWDERGDVTPAVEDLLRQAAERGANGILLDPEAARDETTRIVTGGFKGTYLAIPYSRARQSAYARAIYDLNQKK
jgi:hypothetical protein